MPLSALKEQFPEHLPSLPSRQLPWEPPHPAARGARVSSSVGEHRLTNKYVITCFLKWSLYPWGGVALAWNRIMWWSAVTRVPQRWPWAELCVCSENKPCPEPFLPNKLGLCHGLPAASLFGGRCLRFGWYQGWTSPSSWLKSHVQNLCS